MDDARAVFNAYFIAQWEASGLTKAAWGRAIGLSKQSINEIVASRKSTVFEHLDLIAKWRRVPLSMILREVAHFAFDYEGQSAAPPAPSLEQIPGGVARPVVARAINRAEGARRASDSRRESDEHPSPPREPSPAPRR